MKKLYVILLLILVVVGVMRIFYEHNSNKIDANIEKRFEAFQKTVIADGGENLTTLRNSQELDVLFKNKLSKCEPINAVSEGFVNYVIYGKEGDKCKFTKTNQLVQLDCLVPMEVAIKYSVTNTESDTYIDDVHNNPRFCKQSFGLAEQKTEQKSKK